MSLRIGLGTDQHLLVEGRPLIIGGVHIPFHTGCLGHSDADPLLHALCDALLGALALGDIGFHFPDTDPAYKNIDSCILLEKVNTMVSNKGYSVVNIDAVIHLEKPKLSPHISRICASLSKILKLDVSAISVKAKTAEGMGPVGEGKAVAAMAVVLLERVS
jgi:2-C-methyl-D-erythritol 2,4-cyclodiphosphate synthase